MSVRGFTRYHIINMWRKKKKTWRVSIEQQKHHHHHSADSSSSSHQAIHADSVRVTPCIYAAMCLLLLSCMHCSYIVNYTTLPHHLSPTTSTHSDTYYAYTEIYIYMYKYKYLYIFYNFSDIHTLDRPREYSFIRGANWRYDDYSWFNDFQ